jgi:hypothetical protein
MAIYGGLRLLTQEGASRYSLADFHCPPRPSGSPVMFCSQCGAKAAGKFCSACGAPLLAIVPGPNADEHNPQPPIDWQNLVDYAALLRIPEVRDRIAASAAQSKKRMTGEEFLEMYGAALGKFTGVPLPMAKMAPYVQSWAASLGMKTGKSRTQFIPSPPGTVIVSLLCSLARHGREMRSVQQFADGCVLKASLPSDLWSMEGNLILAVARRPGGAQVDARTDIQGQVFDWGKSTRCLDELFRELSAAA